LYLRHVVPPTPPFIPAEWRAIVASASLLSRVFIHGGVGSGKTQVLYAIAHELRQTGQVPLYLRVSDYARYAADMDVIQFAATEGEFWQTFHDETLSREFAKALADAQRSDRLVLLADQCDDLFENEWPNVSRALNRFQRLIVAERAPHLPLGRTASATINLPTLSVPVLIDLAQTKGAPNLHESQLIELQEQGIEVTPAIVSVVAEIAHTTGDLHPVTIMRTWIDNLLRQARPTESLVAALDKAHKLLPELARIRQRLDWPRAEPNDLTDDTVNRVFRDPTLELRDQAEGRILLDFCARAGLLMRVGAAWQFTSPAIERFFAAEYAARGTWTSLWPRQRTLMAWTAALLVRYGSSYQQERFFAQLKSALERVTDLSALEALDILGEVSSDLPAALIFRDETLRRFRELAKVESEAVRYAVQLRAERLGLKVGLSRKVEPPLDLIPGQVLDKYARDLPELLRQLDMTPPKGREDQWLENRVVLNALIEELRTQPDPIIRYQCAAWLRHAALSKTIEVQIPSQPWKSRTLRALDVLAEIALNPAEDLLTLALVKSVLAKDEFVLPLWQSRTEYVPLVYELLLAMDKRLFATQAAPGKQDWYVSG
ncbi:MAG: ATP-binding protein, partial [Chloroflexi bacterium]|nr:ATP-binding protein [Chloroflexota bacterium]